MKHTPLFGPGGNAEIFKKEGHKSTLDAPAWIKQFGLDIYEYEAGRGVGGSDDMFRALGAAAKEAGVGLSIHAPYFISLSSLEESKRLGSSKYILDSARALHFMGSKDGTIVIHAGSCAKLDRGDATKMACDALYYAVEQLQNASLYGFHLGIETMGKVNQLGTLDEVLTMCGVDEKVYPVVDFGHMNAREQGGVFAAVDDYKRVFDEIATRKSPEAAMHLHCHFSKIEYTAGGEKRHLTFDDTVYGPDPDLFIKAVYDLGVCPHIISESDGTQAEDARYMKQAYEALKAGENV